MQLQSVSDSTTLSYWLNWRVLICAIWVLTPMVIALFMIWRYEARDPLKSDTGEIQQDVNHNFYGHEVWRPCLRNIHPIWLLAFRLLAFSLMMATLIAKLVRSGVGMFFYYTQWTFALLTIYFGYGSLLSIYGCYQYGKLRGRRSSAYHAETDTEQGSYMPLLNEEGSSPQKDYDTLKLPRICTCAFEVIFQICAGAVVLTDCVYWLIIFPFLTIKDYNLNFMTVNLHTLNAVLLIGDTVLNCLQVPFFRITFFVLWTGVFVIFQWTIHASVSINWWPYPFLDLSSPHAPIWYLLIALLHIPCYGIFSLIVKLKHLLLSKWFPSSCQC